MARQLLNTAASNPTKAFVSDLATSAESDPVARRKVSLQAARQSFEQALLHGQLVLSQWCNGKVR